MRDRDHGGVPLAWTSPACSNPGGNTVRGERMTLRQRKAVVTRGHRPGGVTVRPKVSAADARDA